MVGGAGESVPVPTRRVGTPTVLRLDYEEAMELTLARPDLRRLWLKTYAGSLRKIFLGDAPKRSTMMLALIHDSPATRPTAERLIKRLSDVGEQLGVLSDSDVRLDSPNVRFRPLREDGRDLTPEEIREQGAQWQDAHRIIFDVHTYLTPELTARLMELVDRAIYFVPADGADAAIRRLRAIDVTARGWRDKISVAWVIKDNSPVVPAVPDLADLAARDFKIHETPPGLPSGRSLSYGLERLVHDLRGVRVGVALGGGAARGLSHLGVLKVSRARRSRRRHDRGHQRRRPALTGILLGQPGCGLQRGCVRRGLRPLLDFSPVPQAHLAPPLQVSPRPKIRLDAAEVLA